VLEDLIATTIRPSRLTSETDTINGGAETGGLGQEHNHQPFQFSFHGLRPYQPSQSRIRSMKVGSAERQKAFSLT
jgi:hypothetical protein